MDYIEKLRIVHEIYLGGTDCSVAEEEIIEVEKKLDLSVPMPLREFYSVFGACRELLKSFFDIALPNELYHEDNILYFADENQGVCCYGINISTHELVYIDQYIMEPMPEDLEDFLLCLLALQGTEFFPRAGVLNCSALEAERYFTKITKSISTPVFYNMDGLIAYFDEEKIILSARDDATFERFEDDNNLDLEHL